MTAKYITTLLGVLSMLNICLIVVAQKLCKGFASFGKKPIVFGIVTAILTAGSICLASGSIANSFSQYWVFAFAFLMFGVLHMFFAHKKFIALAENEKINAVLAELIFATAIMLFATIIFSAIQYFFISKEFLFYPLIFTCFFFITPFAIHYSFISASNIPQPFFKNWEYPLLNPIDPPEEKANEKILVIGFEAAKDLNDVTKTYFRLKTPESLLLGDLFYHFLTDYNESQGENKIQILDDNASPLIWNFRLKTKWYQPEKVLNPCLSVRENKIEENAVIICEHFINQSNNNYNEPSN